MWDKPSELTVYPYAGYEIIAMGGGRLSQAVQNAMSTWSGSSFHNAVILNLAPWNALPWQALGCSIDLLPYPRATSTTGYWYASCWFGFEADTTD
jgi:hypothetical protein